MNQQVKASLNHAANDCGVLFDGEFVQANNRCSYVKAINTFKCILESYRAKESITENSTLEFVVR